MDELKNILLDKIKEFNEIGHRYIIGEITRGDFRSASCRMGVYAHRDGKTFMVRLRIPGGAVSLKNLEKIYDLASKYKLSRVHITTRQNIQLHGLNIDEICEVMKTALENDIYTIGSGGGYPGNIIVSPLSEVELNDKFDVVPYALAVNNHIMKKINTYMLPKKLQMAFSNGSTYNINYTVTDLGFLAAMKDGKEYFKLYLGGGLGRNAAKGIEFDELVEPKELLYHVEAMTKLFINEGDYVNKGRARIRYIVDRMGKDEFIKCYKGYLEKEKLNTNLDITVSPKEYEKDGIVTNIKDSRIFKQRQWGLYSIYIHPVGGQLKLEDIRVILDELKNIEGSEIRLSTTGGFYIINLNGEEAERLLQITKNMSGTTRLEQSIACVGTPTCQIGILNSQGMLNEIISLFREKGMTKDILPRLHISGCPNSCGCHEAYEIGLAGRIKIINEQSTSIYKLYIQDTSKTGNSNLSKYYGDLLQEKVPEFLYELAELSDKDNLEFSQWINENKEKVEHLIQKFSI